MSVVARCWRFTIGLSAYFSVVSCVTPLPDNLPPLVESRARDIVAVIDVTSVRFYERTGGFGYPMVDDNGREYFQYASAPPFRVRARVVTQLYGPALDRTVSFKTHSHWGKDRLTSGSLKLVHLVTDGDILEEPDEHDTDVGIDVHGRLFVPAYSYGIGILPCGTDALKEPIAVKTPSSRYGEPWEGYDESLFTWTRPEVVKKIKDDDQIYYRIEGKRRYPRYGMPIDSIARFLQEKQPGIGDFWCYLG